MTESAGLNIASLPASSKVLCGCYAAIAVVALVATWSQNAAYLGRPGTFLIAFFQDLTVTPASRSFSADLLLVFVSAAILMAVEARKHSIRFVWWYIIAGLVIAISVTFPLFLIARELKIAGTSPSELRSADALLLAALAAGTVAVMIWIVV